MPATMPLRFLRTLVKDMKVGDGGYIPASFVAVDAKEEVYVCGEASHMPDTDGIVDPVAVSRGPDGYSLDLNGCRCQWDRRISALHALIGTYLPVEQVYDSKRVGR